MMRLIFMIDVSGSMKGYKIRAVDDAMDNVIDELRDYSLAHESVSISVLLFSKNVSWMQEEDMNIEDFNWTHPECNGMTSLGAACIALKDKLEEDSDRDYKILLLSDGCPTDDYDEGIRAFDSTPSFIGSQRYAIALGEDADIPSLIKFTTDPNKVFKVSDLNALLATMTNALQIEAPEPEPQPIEKTNVETDDEWS